ncbi:type II secretion system protein GspE [Fimbriimonadia bacterium ATM]|nr:MAG: type II secretion system protein GspE [Armatimonadota bacterium]MBC6970761.1 type II secretion system protein GspE [Armatimonadota bacterium]MCE7900900.1 type II secretion system protein GspE [Armatimonadetes bacterium ATM1]MDL1929672.1 type II secretion system protein GspE [Fimbriimonadia bacterium ATM]RIJ94472.1 MAG: type II secretion system protein GspE [Armatimonadota bacterium]
MFVVRSSSRPSDAPEDSTPAPYGNGDALAGAHSGTGNGASSISWLPTIDLAETQPDPTIIERVPAGFALQNQILPLWMEGASLAVAIGTVEALKAADDLSVLLSMPVKAYLADAAIIRERIEERFIEEIMAGLPAEEGAYTEIDESTDLADLQKMAGETAVVQMVNLVFAQAVRDSASDIHIEPYEREVKVRYRIDGMLHDVMRPPKRMHAAIVSRLKILGEMNIAERRLPQDGRIRLQIAGRQIDVRVSIVPTVYGERAVMRILDKSTAMLGLNELGMVGDTFEKFRRLIRQPHGIILVTGPTGSGKSTTLYASLQEIYSPTTNILTIEDPVEYQVPGIGQIQVRPNIGLTFANGLRSIVRQDPDIIMVGEIRDHETAEIAIHAALTGHLVFSTLHTNDAAGAVTRLLDMGVEPYLAASSLIGVVAQRLVRQNCLNCAQPTEETDDALRSLGITREEAESGRLMRGVGCDKCQGTGYRRRTGLFEFFLVDENIRRMTVERASASAMKQYAVDHQGMRTLLGDGKLAVLAGKTTIEEVLRVAQREDF